MVDQDVPHHLAHVRVQVRAIIERLTFAGDQLQVRLVHQRRGLQRMSGFSRALAARQLMQAIVDARDQRLERSAVAPGHAGKNFGDLGFGVHAHRPSLGMHGIGDVGIRAPFAL